MSGSRFKRDGRRRAFLALLAALVIVAVAAADQRGWLLVRRVDDLSLFQGRRVTVTRVIDGCTLVVDHPDPLNRQPETTVRLWGVQCGQLARYNRPADPFAVEAAEKTRSMVESKTVTLRLETHRQRDSLGRLLAHVTGPGGRTLAEHLLEAGLAATDDRWPHTMSVRFAQLEFAAKRKGVGRWAKPR